MSAPRYSGTYGVSMLDRTPIRIEATWDELCELWAALAQEPRRSDSKSGIAITDAEGKRIGWRVKPSTPFFSPFLMKPGAEGKTKDNLVGCGAWFGADVDSGWTLDRLVHRFDSPSFAHTTTSHTAESPHLRIMLPVSRPMIDEFEYQAAWHFFNDMLEGSLDPSTKNINRLLYVPAAWEGRDNEHRVRLNGTPWEMNLILVCARDRAVVMPEPESCGGWDGDIVIGAMTTPAMLSQFASEPVGGRMWRLMLRIASRAKYLGWEIDAPRLAREAKVADGPTGKKRHDIEREAKRVLARVASFNIVPLAQKGPQTDADKLIAAMKRLRFTRK